MATTSVRRRRPAVTLTVFFLIAVLLLVLVAISKVWTPKLGLDLSGGTTITLTAINSTGTGAVDPTSLEQARTIIEQRVNSLGVGEATVTVVGNDQIQVSAPNVQGDQLVELVGQTAQLEFRRVYQAEMTAVTVAPPETDEGQATVLPGLATITFINDTSAAEVTGAIGNPLADLFPASPTREGYIFAGWNTASDGTGTAFTRDTVVSGSITVFAQWQLPNETETELPSDDAGRLALLTTQLAWTPSTQESTDFASYQCGDVTPQAWDKPFFACMRDDVAEAQGYNYKYLLGPRLIEGSLVASAAAGIPQNELNWIVSLNFNSLGGSLFAQATESLAGAATPTDQFAIVLDGRVISAPKVNEKIPSGSAQISGSFNQDTATNLANVLKYGALPLNFELSNVDTVSATLGGDQLTAGLIAGGIGLLLVVIYSIIYYRGLAFVVFTSLAMAGVMVYLLIVLLGSAVSFALSLPGLAGAIVAIGVTADSFVIFFERVRDEAREGRSVRTAVESGWDKARRTIVAADMVSMLSAVVLFILSIGTVKGFAFTLGLTTLVDLFLIFFFTKPLVSLLVKTDFFGNGRKGSGFEAEHLGIAATRKPRPRVLATAKEGSR